MTVGKELGDSICSCKRYLLWTLTRVLWDPKGSLSKVVLMDDTSLRIWSLNDSLNGAQPSATIKIPTIGDDPTTYLSNAVWNPHAPEIVTVNEGCLSGWDLRSQKSTFSVPLAHPATIRALDYNPNKPHSVVTGGDDGRVRFWDVRNGGKQAVKELSDHTHWIWSVAFNKFHDQLLLSSSSDNLVNLQSVVSISSAAYGAYEDEENDEEGDQSLDPYSNTREKPTDGLIHTYDQHEDSVYAVAWSHADIWTFASLSYDGRIVVNRVPRDEKFRILGV
ncbi:hypothetical protein BC937DRAFT_91161 [Endogone sp. FLAS-F59071]|nr:hypothetical protein BC937DRAFT_91161 [Endogone sp. FLAS-F59071]|eukprot:RUS16476.1 hypothetical protein BC937DRAFT_91161 [Endogone sp. FLAS-F59071]